MSLTRTQARTALRGALLDAASIFGAANSEEQNAALDRHLDGAVMDYNRVLPRVSSDELTWGAGVGLYPAPDDAVSFQSCGLIEEQNALDPYDARRVDIVPTPTLVLIAGSKMWRFAPMPSFTHVAKLGSLFSYTYVAEHVLTDSALTSTLPASWVTQVVLRALVQSLLELAIRNAHKPVALRDPTYSQTRNGTPAAMADQLMRLWEQQVRPTADPYGLLPVAGGRR